MVKPDEEVFAYPQVSMFNDIIIRGEEHAIRIGGFSAGGFYLEEPYDLVKKERDGITGNMTYYSFVRSSAKLTKQEKAIKKRKADSLKYKKDRVKSLQEDLEVATKDLAEAQDG